MAELCPLVVRNGQLVQHFSNVADAREHEALGQSDLHMHAPDLGPELIVVLVPWPLEKSEEPTGQGDLQSLNLLGPLEHQAGRFVLRGALVELVDHRSEVRLGNGTKLAQSFLMLHLEAHIPHNLVEDVLEHGPLTYRTSPLLSHQHHTRTQGAQILHPHGRSAQSLHPIHPKNPIIQGTRFACHGDFGGHP